MKAPAMVLGLALGASPVMAPLVVVDGDTVHFGKATVRLVGLDAPEIGKHARCPKEAALADKARAKLVELMDPSNKPSLRFKRQRDKYGRKLATAFSNHKNVAPIMVQAGLAVPYMGHGPRKDWCK